MPTSEPTYTIDRKTGDLIGPRGGRAALSFWNAARPRRGGVDWMAHWRGGPRWYSSGPYGQRGEIEIAEADAYALKCVIARRVAEAALPEKAAKAHG